MTVPLTSLKPIPYSIVDYLGIMATASSFSVIQHIPSLEPPQLFLRRIYAQVLNSDDDTLISLFRRAVKNYYSLTETPAPFSVPQFYRHYAFPPFYIPHIHVTMEVNETIILMTTQLSMQRNSPHSSLILDGQNQKVLRVNIDGKDLSPEQYSVTKHELILLSIPTSTDFTVTIKSMLVQPVPKSDLFISNVFYTINRPEILSTITTTLVVNAANRSCCLAGGSILSRNKTHGNLMEFTWVDHCPKPSYLFGCFIGNLEVQTSEFQTRSGNLVNLEVWVEKGKGSKAAYALHILKRALKFEETEYDREYDRRSLTYVCIPNFKAGVMGIKGLVFIDSDIALVDNESSTDREFRTAAYALSYGYFMNRVYLWSFFEKPAIDSLTALKASSFTEKYFGKEYMRVDDILNLWEYQFFEDASTKAHPLIPASYTDIRQLSDCTAQFKGKAVMQALQTAVDTYVQDGFKKALSLFHCYYEGNVATHQILVECCNEIVKNSGIDLTPFQNWFYQKGTPQITVEIDYDEKKQETEMTVTQCCQDGSEEPQYPLPIPCSIELLDIKGNILLQKTNFILKKEKETFLFHTSERPIPIIMHGYNAPVHINCEYTLHDLACLILHSREPITKWHATLRHNEAVLTKAMDILKTNPDLKEKSDGDGYIFGELIELYKQALQSPDLSYVAKARLLEIPAVQSYANKFSCYDFQRIKEARSVFLKQLGLQCRSILRELLSHHPEPVDNHIQKPTKMKIRLLRNICLSILAEIDPKAVETLYANYKAKSNFNNFMAAFYMLVNGNNDKKEELLHDLATQWKNDPALKHRFLTIAASSNSCIVADLRKLEGMMLEDSKTIRLIFETFCANSGCYHDDQGEGYKYVVDKILEIGAKNPDLAHTAIFPFAFQDLKTLPPKQKALMAQQLERLKSSTAYAKTKRSASHLLKI